MCIGRDEAVCFLDSCETADLKVLADRSDLLCKKSLKILARLDFLSKECFHIRCICRHDSLSDLSDEVLELLVLCDKVCLRVDFDCDSFLLIFRNNCKAEAFRGDSVRLLLCLHLSVLSQELDCLLHVAVCLREGFLAVHHNCAALLTELFYHLCCNSSHNSNPP